MNNNSRQKEHLCQQETFTSAGGGSSGRYLDTTLSTRSFSCGLKMIEEKTLEFLFWTTTRQKLDKTLGNLMIGANLLANRLAQNVHIKQKGMCFCFFIVCLLK